jgi:hypothetical protein
MQDANRAAEQTFGVGGNAVDGSIFLSTADT